MKMPDAVRDDYLIQITTINNYAALEIRSEYATRAPDGGRIVVQGLPPFVSALSEIQDFSVTLPDGHATTLGDLISALRAAAKEVVDAYESAPDIAPGAVRASIAAQIAKRRPPAEIPGEAIKIERGRP